MRIGSSPHLSVMPFNTTGMWRRNFSIQDLHRAFLQENPGLYRECKVLFIKTNEAARAALSTRRRGNRITCYTFISKLRLHQICRFLCNASFTYKNKLIHCELYKCDSSNAHVLHIGMDINHRSIWSMRSVFPLKRFFTLFFWSGFYGYVKCGLSLLSPLVMTLAHR